MKYAITITALAALLPLVAMARTPKTADEAVRSVLSTSPDPESAEDGATKLRRSALREAAQVYGSQSGWAARWSDLEVELIQRDQKLSEIFRFSTFYLRGGVLQPPILDVGADVSVIKNNGSLQELVDRVYRVLVPACLTHTPLTWRDFLLPRAPQTVAPPRETMLPRDALDREMWEEGVRAGWELGQRQANEEFRERLTALNNAFQGMALYTMLAMRGMIAPPAVMETNEGTEASADGKTLAINRRERVIHKESYFVVDPGSWQPIDLEPTLKSP
jgi:defect-in-organelle-trafficking protein DotC